jgi:hypothetical protein
LVRLLGISKRPKRTGICILIFLSRVSPGACDCRPSGRNPGTNGDSGSRGAVNQPHAGQYVKGISAPRQREEEDIARRKNGGHGGWEGNFWTGLLRPGAEMTGRFRPRDPTQHLITPLYLRVLRAMSPLPLNSRPLRRLPCRRRQWKRSRRCHAF